MVAWTNSLGGGDQWLFQYEQAVTNISSEGQSINSPIVGDIATEQGNKRRVPGKDVQYVTLKADQLTLNELQGLHDIKNAGYVLIYDSPTIGTRKQVSVKVNNGFETTFTTGKGNYEFTLQLEMPDNFDLFKFLL